MTVRELINELMRLNLDDEIYIEDINNNYLYKTLIIDGKRSNLINNDFSEVIHTSIKIKGL